MKNLLLISLICLVLPGCDDEEKDPFVGPWEYTPSTHVTLATDTLRLSFQLKRSGDKYVASDVNMDGFKSWETDIKDVVTGHKIGVMVFDNSKHATATTQMNLTFYNCLPSSNSLFADSVVIHYGTTKSTYKNQVLLTVKEK